MYKFAVSLLALSLLSGCAVGGTSMSGSSLSNDTTPSSSDCGWGVDESGEPLFYC